MEHIKTKKHTLSVAITLAVFVSLSAVANEATKHTETMVITANQYETAIKNAPASISVITSEEIDKFPATDISAALESVAGVHVAKTTGTEPRIIIRGLQNQNSSNGNYTLFLINGRRISSSETVIRGASFDLSSIPMSAIEQIEVVRGPMSSLYGSEAIGGVVNVILKKASTETHVSGSLTYSTPNDNKANALLPGASGELKAGNAFVSGSIIPDVLTYTTTLDASDRNAWFPENAGENFSPQSEQKRNVFRGSLNWFATERDDIYLDVSYSQDDRVENSYFSNFNRIATSYYDGKKLTSTLGHVRSWDWGESDTSYFYETAEVYENNFHPMVDEAELSQDNHTVDAKFVVDQFESQILSLGGQISYTSVENQRDYSSSRSVTQSAVYVQDEYFVTDDFATTFSGRLTHNDQFGNDFSPRVYFVYNGIDSVTFKGGYGEGFKSPTIFQSSEDFSLVSCGGRCSLVGNPDLKPQTSKSYELSAMYSGVDGYIQVTGFFNDVKNLIDRDLDPFFSGSSTVIRYENVDKVETKGVELEGNYDFSASWSFTANATYTDAINKVDNEEIAYTPEWLANANINWLATHDLAFFTGLNYTGQQKDGSDDELDPYTIISLGGSYAFNDNFKFRAGVTNLTDERLDHSTQSYEATEVGRTYYAKVDFDF
ncbi:TonB-dependent receptor [uncultured Vibrio sp.]|uniref:TonB-dependent receptor domain-containing protein n=1 Tax=uncultured Vibrio sp. TaxID=114054 RepID=UPI0025DF359E|nr:TonB-dependent receptor [uncultured Vibrio sp.]